MGEAFFDEGEDLVVAEVEPWGGYEITWRDLAGEALDNDVWVEAFDEVDDEFDVIVKREQMKIIGVGDVFVSHFCALEYLQLMELHRGERQFGYDICSVEHHVAGFAREPEDEMGAAWEAITVDEFDGIFSAGEGVSAVDSF